MKRQNQKKDKKRYVMLFFILFRKKLKGVCDSRLRKAWQAALDEESRNKREDEWSKREAAKKATDEEKGRKDKDRRKRAQEEHEREQERERKKKEKEDRTRKEREKRERKAREERLAKEKEKKIV
jgi:hypothetical protein